MHQIKQKVNNTTITFVKEDDAAVEEDRNYSVLMKCYNKVVIDVIVYKDFIAAR